MPQGTTKTDSEITDSILLSLSNHIYTKNNFHFLQKDFSYQGLLAIKVKVHWLPSPIIDCEDEADLYEMLKNTFWAKSLMIACDYGFSGIESMGRSDGYLVPHDATTKKPIPFDSLLDEQTGRCSLQSSIQIMKMDGMSHTIFKLIDALKYIYGKAENINQAERLVDWIMEL